jgi:hypothetical protein
MLSSSEGSLVFELLSLNMKGRGVGLNGNKIEVLNCRSCKSLEVRKLNKFCACIEGLGKKVLHRRRKDFELNLGFVGRRVMREENERRGNLSLEEVEG